MLINATPVGMYPGNGASPADIARLPALEGVIERHLQSDRTPLVLAAQKRGLPAAGGLWMLVMQAVLAAEKFLAKSVDTERAADIYAALRAERLNIVLIGMPGSGKTTLGRALAEALRRPFVDCDAEIERAAGMPIPEIFRTQGEAAFRALESEIIARFGRESGQVIATGGGAPLREGKRRRPAAERHGVANANAPWSCWPPLAAPSPPAAWRRCAAWKLSAPPSTKPAPTRA